MAPKGSGSENMSFLKMLNPSEGRTGVKKFVLQCIFESGARPCPPMIVGVGLGGTSDVAMQLAKEASTFRRIGSASPDADVAQLEQELLEKMNQTGIGPQGLGGSTTALAVNIEWAHTHISARIRGGEHSMLARRAGFGAHLERWKGAISQWRIINRVDPAQRGGYSQAATGRHGFDRRHDLRYSRRAHADPHLRRRHRAAGRSDGRRLSTHGAGRAQEAGWGRMRSSPSAQRRARAWTALRPA
jgi:hypothetical protein